MGTIGLSRTTSASGRIEGREHRFPIRVYYEDTDAAGIVYYANYLKFAERARSEWLRLIGVQHRELSERTGASWAVRRCEIDYLSPARLDDDLEVTTRVHRLGGASVSMEQIIRRGAVDLARLVLRIAFVTVTGKPARLPGDVSTALRQFVQP